MARVERILRLLLAVTSNLPEDDRPGWWRPWQPQILSSLLAHPRVILQGCRQAAGKSYVAALWAAIYIICGYRVAIGMPSLRQSSRILLRRILLWMLCVEQVMGLKRRTNNVLEVEWNNGGGLMALSTNEAAEKGVQGYTCALLVIDEGHEAPNDMFGAYSPLPAIALKRGYGSILILGVGGPQDTVIEAKKPAGYHLEFWDDERVLALDPSWRDYFEQQKLELSQDEYDKNFRCLPVSAGQRRVFLQLVEHAVPPGPVKPELYFAIDVGKIVDTTTLLVVEQRGPAANVLSDRRWRGTSYIDQVQEVAAFIDEGYTFNPYNVAVETNGPGEVFLDALRRVYPFSGARGVKTTDSPGSRRKTLWIQRLQRRAEKGLLGVVNPQLRADLLSLAYEVKEDGRYLWPHNDNLSALWVFESNTMHAVGV